MLKLPPALLVLNQVLIYCHWQLKLFLQKINLISNQYGSKSNDRIESSMMENYGCVHFCLALRSVVKGAQGNYLGTKSELRETFAWKCLNACMEEALDALGG